MITSPNGCWAAISRASVIPATIDSRSSGSDSVLVMMWGLASGSEERSHTWPRAFGETSTGAITAQCPS